nr:hypothetical protein CFP56_14868 [Quercus suber]
MGEDLDGIVRFGGFHPITNSPIVLVHPQDFSGDLRQFEGHLRDIYNQLDILDFCMKGSPQLHYANFRWHKCVHEYKIMDDNVIVLHMTQYYQYDCDSNWSNGWKDGKLIGRHEFGGEDENEDDHEESELVEYDSSGNLGDDSNLEETDSSSETGDDSNSKALEEDMMLP